MRQKRATLEQALAGFVREHHRFLLAGHLAHLDFLDEQVARFDQQIAHLIADQTPVEAPTHAVVQKASGESDHGTDEPLAWEPAVDLLDTIPGVGRVMAEVFVAEIGTDMRRFASAGHLASWARVSPGNNESAGKRYSGRTGPGNSWLRSSLVQAAHAAVRVKDSYFAQVYRRLAGRRGVKKAIMAVAHRILIAVYYILLRHEPYRAPGVPVADAQRKARLVNGMLQRIETLGYTVRLEPTSATTT